MWPRLKPLIIGLALSAAIFVICFVVLQIAIAVVPEESFGPVGLELYFAWAILMLFFPAFAAGYVAKGSGAVYGGLLAGIPIILFSLVVEGSPTVFYLMWLAVAAVGGHIGQVMALKNRAS